MYINTEELKVPNEENISIFEKSMHNYSVKNEKTEHVNLSLANIMSHSFHCPINVGMLYSNFIDTAMKYSFSKLLPNRKNKI